MTKRLILSFAMIALTIAGVTSATLAYFSAGKVLGSNTTPNTFATGSVLLGGFNIASLSVTGLAPGTPIVIPNVGINYIGDLNADLYIGARGMLGPLNDNYFADKLYLRIFYQGTSSVAWEGKVNALSTDWRKIADNTTAGWKAYDLQFTLDSDTGNNKQGRTNTDTQILVYAVEHGGAVPVTPPYLTAVTLSGSTITSLDAWTP